MRSLFMRSFLVLLMATTLVGLGACGKKSGGSGSDTSAVAKTGDAGADAAKNEEKAREFVDKVFNQGDTAYVMQALAPNFVDHNPSPGYDPGPAGFVKALKEFRAGFPDLKMTVVDVIASGNKVVTRSTMSGTNSGAMMGMAPTNKAMTDIEGIDIVTIVDGKVTEHWGQFDAMKMMTQLGLMPSDTSHTATGGSGDTATHH